MRNSLCCVPGHRFPGSPVGSAPAIQVQTGFLVAEVRVRCRCARKRSVAGFVDKGGQTGGFLGPFRGEAEVCEGWFSAMYKYPRHQHVIVKLEANLTPDSASLWGQVGLLTTMGIQAWCLDLTGAGNVYITLRITL